MALKHPLVSVLIPVYNRVSLVHKAIQSALAQDYAHFEVVVSDNCSDDGTWESLKNTYDSDPRVVLVRTERNLGPVPNWLNCFNNSRGDYIKFVFSDDWMLPSCLSAMSQILEKSRAGVSIASVMEWCDGKQTIAWDLKALSAALPYIGPAEVSSLLMDFEIPLSPGAALYRRDALKIQMSYGNKELDELARRGIGPDIAMLLHACRSGCVLMPEVLAVFRRHGGSISEQHAEELHRAYRRFLIHEGRLGLFKRFRMRMRNLTNAARSVARKILV